MPSPRRGRPPIDPGGTDAERLPGICLPPAVRERADQVTDRYVAWNGGTRASARRAIFLAGVDAVEAALRSREELHRESLRSRDEKPPLDSGWRH